MHKPCFIVPSYNHSAAAIGTIGRLSAFGLPIVLVDDGSEAGDAAILRRIAAENPLVTLVVLPAKEERRAAKLAAEVPVLLMEIPLMHRMEATLHLLEQQHSQLLAAGAQVLLIELRMALTVVQVVVPHMELTEMVEVALLDKVMLALTEQISIQVVLNLPAVVVAVPEAQDFLQSVPIQR